MPTRRQFNAQMLGSLVTFGLVETLWTRDLFADAVKPTIQKWLADLVAMTKDLRGAKLTDLQFQTKMEELYKRVDLKELCTLIKLDEIEKKPLPDNGASNAGIDLAKIDGLPKDVGFGKPRPKASRRSDSRTGAVSTSSPEGTWSIWRGHGRSETRSS